MNKFEDICFIMNKNNLLGVIKTQKSLGDIYYFVEKYDDLRLIIGKYIVSFEFYTNVNQILFLKCYFNNGQEIKLAISKELKILLEKIYYGRIK